MKQGIAVLKSKCWNCGKRCFKCDKLESRKDFYASILNYLVILSDTGHDDRAIHNLRLLVNDIPLRQELKRDCPPPVGDEND